MVLGCRKSDKKDKCKNAQNQDLRHLVNSMIEKENMKNWDNSQKYDDEVEVLQVRGFFEC